MDKKYLLLNYLDCNETYKSIIHNEIYHIGLDYSDQVIKKFSDSKQGCLSQFVFLFLNSHLIGYMFIMKDANKDKYDHSCLARHNADELSKDEALLLLEEGIKVCTVCHAKHLKNCFINELKLLLK